MYIKKEQRYGNIPWTCIHPPNTDGLGGLGGWGGLGWVGWVGRGQVFSDRT